jgi:hypothetical protein
MLREDDTSLSQVPLPRLRAEGLGVGAVSRLANLHETCGKVVCNPIIREAEHAQSSRTEYAVSLRVVVPLLVMDATIHFDNKPCGVAAEIDDEAVNHVLTAEMQPGEQIAAKMFPEDCLGRCHNAAKFARLIAEGVRMMDVSAAHTAPTPAPSPASGGEVTLRDYPFV